MGFDKPPCAPGRQKFLKKDMEIELQLDSAKVDIHLKVTINRVVQDG